MDFYRSIHHQYDFIFPFNTKQLEFVKSEIQSTSTLLDIGCATGNLAIALAENNYNVEAFDLDEAMIKMARSKIQLPNLDFRIGNMLNLERNYSDVLFDGILCFGNTVVHLTEKELILQFFQSVYQQLKPGGKFLFQLLNYEYILKEKITSLPLIENDQIRFDRQYDFLNNGLLNFKTELTIKESNQVIKNEVELFPITKTEIASLLKDAGFTNLTHYGNFAKADLKPDSIPLVISVKK